MSMEARHKVAAYLKKKASPETNRILEKFFLIKQEVRADFEISSESILGGKKYARLALTCLHRDAVLGLFSEIGHSKQKVERYMFNNKQDHCFGMGIADYDPAQEQRRVKLYNYYHLSRQNIDWPAQLKKICKTSQLSWVPVAQDIACFNKAWMSAVDFYDNGDLELKVYFGPFLSTDITGKFKGLFNSKAVARYGKLLKAGVLSDIVLFCVRYSKQGRSVRTDFWYMTRRIAPYLMALDQKKEATRLYNDLQALGLPIRLTFICMDLDNRPRTQFYFVFEGL